MKLTHLSYNFFKVSDADAASLARAMGDDLPRHGYELPVVLPNGKKAWLQRTPNSSYKRGWVWAVYSNNRITSDEEREGPYQHWGQVYRIE